MVACTQHQKELEKYEKPKGRRRKTVFYWKKLIREAGWDQTNIGALTGDRKKWKALVKDRMKHLLRWEESKGNKWTEGEVIRNQVREETVVFKCDVCGKTCRSKGGLVNHRRRIHELSDQRKKFRCQKCELEFDSEASLKNHLKVCGGAKASAPGRRRCVCGKEFSDGYFRRHRNRCAMWATSQTEEPPAPARQRPRVTCTCGATVLKTNHARHIKEACPSGEA